MQNQLSKPRRSPRTSGGQGAKKPFRLSRVIAFLVVLGVALGMLAWIDGGEEPLRRIVAPVSVL